MELVYVGVLLFALAFALIVIYISFVLKRVSSTIETLGETLGEVEGKLQYITPEIRNTLHETEKMVDDFDDKIKATDNVFKSLENVGTSLNSSSEMLAQQAKKLPEYTSTQSMNRIAESIRWGEVAYRIAKKWKHRNDKNELIAQEENLPVKK
ncbi:Uncharacterized protein YoxC, contains an MCP-like domain [Virgibacillus subterraneus]|uniref:Uncharacterized protein YoxC, contains an MCP-like domain n=1 Tax=Virgibacillus subterraneus TaxID=621109 RepID=A0A1H9KWB2_9BACI|nr:DUF948 domain-containing protein [Virgibacillus subterraneus]SER03482.1 Uncharacterized protein YoxC, contains an MCP-like domain [Virgibacillus subterraneus]